LGSLRGQRYPRHAQKAKVPITTAVIGKAMMSKKEWAWCMVGR
jgi:hypothetical protein